VDAHHSSDTTTILTRDQTSSQQRPNGNGNVNISVGLKNGTTTTTTTNGYSQNHSPIIITANNVTSNKPALVATFKSGLDKPPMENQSQRKIGSIADYDPLGYEINSNGVRIMQQPNMNRNVYSTGSLAINNSQQQQSTRPAYNSSTNIIANNGGYTNGNNGKIMNIDSQQQQYHGKTSNGLNHHEFDIPGMMLAQSNSNNSHYNHQQQQQMYNSHQHQIDIKTSVYKAIYDYDAKEDDEISFRDGDKFINCEQIDVGWMIGVHEKTGKHGMFPANYAEPVDYF
jgi:hypothetical protein